MTTTDTVPGILTELAGASAEEILADAARRFGGRVAFASSLGLEDQVLTAMIAEAKLDIPIFTLDTGRLFPETYDLIDRTSKRYGVTIHTYFPAAAEVEKMVDRDGVNLFRDSIEARKRCCEIRKVLPMRRAQIELDAWVCGLRTGQGATRQKVEVAEWDYLADMVKINPLAAWSEERVRDYVRAHDVPYNPLHDAGFPSIGCAPCTRAVAAGEDARSGRWWWESAEHRECGLHYRTGHWADDGTSPVAPPPPDPADVAS
ncbi:MAG: phosphoadenylyl-sulfate reductase [Thermoleophilia bacterium]